MKKNTAKATRMKDPGKTKKGKNPTHQSEADADEKYDGKNKKKDG